MYNTVPNLAQVDFSKYRDIVFVGDIHGSFGVLAHLSSLMNETLLIQVGDFGAGFLHPASFHAEMEHLSSQLIKNDNAVVVIRGNHDEPAYFDNRHYKNRVFLVKDNQTLSAADHKLFLLGGALSVDRVDRIEGRSWWFDEACKPDWQVIDEVRDITGVVTHTCPTSFPSAQTKSSLVEYFATEKGDKTLKSDLVEEQRLLQQVYDRLWVNNKSIQFWVHGHFHRPSVWDDGNGVSTRCLEINATWSPTVFSFTHESN